MRIVGGLVVLLVLIIISGTAFSQTAASPNSLSTASPLPLPQAAQQLGQATGQGQSSGPTGSAGGVSSGSGSEGGSNAGIGAPATSAPNGSNSTAAASAATRTYAAAAALGDLLEIDTSKIALVKSSSADVKAFARAMIQQHGEIARKFRAAIMKNHLAISLPSMLDDKHRQAADELRKAAAGDFDRKYLVLQVHAHEEALQLHQLYARNGDNPVLRDEASSIAKIVQDHINHLQALTQKLKVTM